MTTLPPPIRAYRTLGPELLEDLRRSGYQRIALQVPAGLSMSARSYAEEITRATGASVVLVARACFGACDPPARAEVPGAEALVALGHAPIPNMPVSMPMYLAEMRLGKADPARVAETLVAAHLPSRVGLVASIQHLDDLPPVIEALGARGIEAQIARGPPRLAYPGQALGCNYSSATALEEKVHGFVFLGTGRFHPLGLALSVERPVWALDPLQMLLEGPFDRQGMINRRLLEIERAMDAKVWGVLVSSLAGQSRGALARRLVGKAEARGREAMVITFDRLFPADLLGRGVDAYVSTACPRIATDDGTSYDRPILTPPEFLSAIGERPLMPYLFDAFP